MKLRISSKKCVNHVETHGSIAAFAENRLIQEVSSNEFYDKANWIAAVLPIEFLTNPEAKNYNPINLLIDMLA